MEVRINGFEGIFGRINHQAEHQRWFGRFSQKFALGKRLQDRLMKALADPVGFALMLLSSGCARRHSWQGKKGVGAFAY